MVIKTKMKASELCFYIFWFFLQIGKGMGFTSRDQEYMIILVVGIPFVFARLIMMKWDTKSLVKCILLNCLGLIIAVYTRTTTYLLSIVCITAVKGLNINNLLKMVLSVRAPLFVARTTLAVAGVLDPEVMYRYTNGAISTVRYALGYGHANTAQYELVMLIMVAFYLYSERIRIHHYLLALAYNQLMYHYTDSKTSYAICVLFVTLTFICGRYGSRVIKKIAVFATAKSWYVGVMVAVLGCLAYVYIPSFRSLGTFSSRFQTAISIIQKEELQLFGNPNIVTDLGYVYLLYNGGIVLACLFVFSVNKLLKTEIVLENVFLLLVFACYSVFNMMESYTYSVLSNCFLLFLAYVIYSPPKYNVIHISNRCK